MKTEPWWVALAFVKARREIQVQFALARLCGTVVKGSPGSLGNLMDLV